MVRPRQAAEEDIRNALNNRTTRSAYLIRVEDDHDRDETELEKGAMSKSCNEELKKLAIELLLVVGDAEREADGGSAKERGDG